MRCEFCEFAISCNAPASLGGGCDRDGSDDFGCGVVLDEEGEAEDAYEDVEL